MAFASTPRLNITLVVAATLQNGIGAQATLPWRLPKEMAYFAKVTSTAPPSYHNAVVMGRKTWESIPPRFRPLKRRHNVVVSSQSQYDLGSSSLDAFTPPPSVHTSLKSALSILSQAPIEEPSSVSKSLLHHTFLIGGASLYTQSLSLPSTNRILLTRILSPAFEECDVFFPNLNQRKQDGINDEVSNIDDSAVTWKQTSHAELVNWVGFDVPEGEQEEQGVRYEFQMWIRDASEQ